jgi:dephospho-CoA kinase
LLKVGLTGGIASGKSVAAEMFAQLGAHVIKADEIAHGLMEPGEAVYAEVVQQFGSGILNPDRTINRSALAEAAFGEAARNRPSRVQELNRIVHPAVIERQEQWMEQVGKRDRQAVAIVEAALILEAGAADRFDRIVVVTCRPEQKIERWARRMKIDEETARREVERRTAAQLSDADKIKTADYVIDNSGSLDETSKQVRTLYANLSTEASKQI